ncbi:MAG: DnaD domain protein [Chloroflexota bacterium]|nr:DnaD domain protein [Chloroflexota bacterium]
MSIKVTSWVWEHSPYKETRLLLHLALADFCDDRGVCVPGVQRIADKARTGKRNAQDILRQMVADGQMRVAYNAGIKTAFGTTNLYTLVSYQSAHAIVDHIPRRGVKRAAGGDPQTTPGVILPREDGVIPRPPDPSVNPSDHHHADPTTIERPNCFALYEQNIGLLTAMISDELKDIAVRHTDYWIAEAFRRCVVQNKRSLAYAKGIFKRWERDGYDTATDQVAGKTEVATPPKYYTADEDES